jgi:hypothetical protein
MPRQQTPPPPPPLLHRHHYCQTDHFTQICPIQTRTQIQIALIHRRLTLQHFTAKIPPFTRPITQTVLVYIRHRRRRLRLPPRMATI